MRMLATIGLSLAVLAASASAWAKEVHSAHHDTAFKSKAKQADAPREAQRGRGSRPTASRRQRRQLTTAEDRRDRRQASARKGPEPREAVEQDRRAAERLPPPDQLVGQVRVIGPREVGRAAWYGGQHIGARTASGELLDAIHATAAHRSLPLHSMVRVTNLTNGRSAIATINDRGPVSRSLLIDLSPRMAEELDMKHSGIARVAVEPVAEAATAH